MAARTIFQYIRRPVQSIVPFDYYAIDYLMLDALARHFAGVPARRGRTPALVGQEGHGSRRHVEAFPHSCSTTEAQFKALWGKA